MQGGLRWFGPEAGGTEILRFGPHTTAVGSGYAAQKPLQLFPGAVYLPFWACLWASVSSSLSIVKRVKEKNVQKCRGETRKFSVQTKHGDERPSVCPSSHSAVFSLRLHVIDSFGHLSRHIWTV